MLFSISLRFLFLLMQMERLHTRLYEKYKNLKVCRYGDLVSALASSEPLLRGQNGRLGSLGTLLSSRLFSPSTLFWCGAVHSQKRRLSEASDCNAKVQGEFDKYLTGDSFAQSYIYLFLLIVLALNLMDRTSTLQLCYVPSRLLLYFSATV